MKNFGEASFFRKEILVINPGEAIRIPVNRPEAVERVKEEAKNTSVLKILPDIKSYASREEVTLTN